IARRVQNQSVGALRRGFETGDPETFLDGLRKYEEAAKILNLGIENHEEVSAFYQEMINLFLKFIKESSDAVGRFEPKGSFFKLQSLLAVAEVLEDVMIDFVKAANYRSQASMYQKRWKKLLEYIYIIFDLVLSGNFDAADKFLENFDSDEVKNEIIQLAIEDDEESKKNLLECIDAFKSLAAVIIAAARKKTRESVNIIIDKINELSAKGIPITLVVLQRFTQKLAKSFGFDDIVVFETDEQVSLEKLKPPMPPVAEYPTQTTTNIDAETSAANESQMTTAPQNQPKGDLNSKLKQTMESGIQQTISQARQVSTGGHYSGDLNLDAIKAAIAEGMKGLANEIVSQLSSKIGTIGGGSGGVGRRGPLRDLDGPGGGPPQIQSLGRAKPTERPKRPKLSDMLDSVIIDE
ncbi:MAG: hypothetical protein ACTSRA_14925, partial [Promethearchaeota archaeon]